MLLARHARRMMMDGRLRALGRFAKELGFPLPVWLAKERYVTTRANGGWRCAAGRADRGRLGAFAPPPNVPLLHHYDRPWSRTRVSSNRVARVDNYERAFRSLHRQFRWPYPGMQAPRIELAQAAAARLRASYAPFRPILAHPAKRRHGHRGRSWPGFGCRGPVHHQLRT